MQTATRQRTFTLLIVIFVSLTMTSGAVAADTPVAPCQGEGLADVTIRGTFQTAGVAISTYCQGQDGAELKHAGTPGTIGTDWKYCQGEGLTDATIRGISEVKGRSC